MNKKEFCENFYKIYQNPEKEATVSKIPSVLFLSGENCINSFLTLTVMPDTLVGIRKTCDMTFYIRETDSEILYSCARDNLKKYDGDEKIGKMFSCIGDIIKNTDLDGCEILIYQNGLKKSLDRIKEGIELGVYKLSGKEKDFFTFQKKKIKNTENIKQKAVIATSLIKETGKCCYFDETGEKILPLNLKGAKIVVAKFFYEKNNPYIFKEGYAKSLTKVLGKGEMEEFLKILNEVCEDYKNNTPKNSAFRDFYDVSFEKSIARGVYEDSGMFFIVRDEDVDEFIRKNGEKYEKLRGENPEFLVLDNSFAD